MIDFSKSIFSTEYSFSSPRSIIRTLSDAFSKQYCDTKGAIKYAVKKTKGRCIYCGQPMYDLKQKIPVFDNSIHYDHVYAASKLNLFEVGNVAIACSVCNLAKSDRSPIEYWSLRKSEGVPLLIHEYEDFEEFLYEFTKPYREKWPKHYEAGTRKIECQEEFKDLLYELLFKPVDISPISSKYNHEHSVNREIWDKVVENAYSKYSPLTAKDVEGRIGYTNSIFEEYFGISKKIEDITIKEFREFSEVLLISKYESKNETQKYRMLLKILSEVLNSGVESELLIKEIPTRKKLSEMIEEEE